MKIAVLGIGGIGGVLGAFLASKFDDVHFIARGKTLEAIRQNGIKLISDSRGTIFARPASVTDKPEEIGTADIILICTKGYGLENAVKQCIPIIDENTVILPFLNGINISDDIKKYTQKGIAADGAIYVFANIEQPGVIHHSGTMLKTAFGIKNGEKNKNLEALAQMLTESGIESTYAEDILVPLWEKYIMMCGNSCIFAYFNSAAGEIQPDPEKMKFVSAVYGELAALAHLSGAEVSPDIAEKYTKTFLTLPKDTITSLYRDIKNGSPQTEFDSIIGKAYNLSIQLGADTPCINAVYRKYRG